MHLIARRPSKRRPQRLSGDWQAGRSAERGAENKFFDASFDLAEAARELDQTAGIRRTSPVTAAVLGCATSALHSQANALQRMRSLVRHELAPPAGAGTAVADLEELHEALAKIEANLRFSADEADRARRLASAALAGHAPASEELPSVEPEPVRS